MPLWCPHDFDMRSSSPKLAWKSRVNWEKASPRIFAKASWTHHHTHSHSHVTRELKIKTCTGTYSVIFLKFLSGVFNLFFCQRLKLKRKQWFNMKCGVKFAATQNMRWSPSVIFHAHTHTQISWRYMGFFNKKYMIKKLHRNQWQHRTAKLVCASYKISWHIIKIQEALSSSAFGSWAVADNISLSISLFL